MERRSRAGSSLATSSPRTRTVPAVGATSRFTRRINVDLPEPDGPTSTQSAPASTSRLTL